MAGNNEDISLQASLSFYPRTSRTFFFWLAFILFSFSSFLFTRRNEQYRCIKPGRRNSIDGCFSLFLLIRFAAKIEKPTTVEICGRGYIFCSLLSIALSIHFTGIPPPLSPHSSLTCYCFHSLFVCEHSRDHPG